MRAELSNERPPPLGDVVGAALREGRRVRRRRRLGGLLAGGTLALALVLVGGFAAYSEPVRPTAVVAEPASDRVAVPVPASPATAGAPLGRAAAPQPAVSPGSVPFRSSAPATPAPARTLAVHSGAQRAAGTQKKATSGAMLHLLTELLPPGRTSHFAVSEADDLHVQSYLDRGAGPGMIRVSLGRLPADGDRLPRGTTATVTITPIPDNCVQDTVVVSRWPDGTAVQIDVASCLAWNGESNPPARPALTPDEAAKIAADPRWGLTMDAALVDAGAQAFGGLAVFS